jgi:hypothetical protein
MIVIIKRKGCKTLTFEAQNGFVTSKVTPGQEWMTGHSVDYMLKWAERKKAKVDQTT